MLNRKLEQSWSSWEEGRKRLSLRTRSCGLLRQTPGGRGSCDGPMLVLSNNTTLPKCVTAVCIDAIPAFWTTTCHDPPLPAAAATSSPNCTSNKVNKIPTWAAADSDLSAVQQLIVKNSQESNSQFHYNRLQKNPKWLQNQLNHKIQCRCSY